MQIKSFFGAILCLVLAATTACHKHDDDANAPVLTISSPTANASVTGEIHIEGKVTDESLHEMEIKLTKDADGSELFKATPKVHDLTEYDFHEHFTPTLSAETALTLTITVSDHNDHTTTQTVKFIAKP